MSLKKLQRYFENVLVSIDQLLNTLTGGDPDETWSSRFGKYQDRVWLYRVICRVLDIFDPHHCEKSIEEDEGEYQVIPMSKTGKEVKHGGLQG